MRFAALKKAFAYIDGDCPAAARRRWWVRRIVPVLMLLGVTCLTFGMYTEFVEVYGRDVARIVNLFIIGLTFQFQIVYYMFSLDDRDVSDLAESEIRKRLTELEVEFRRLNNGRCI